MKKPLLVTLADRKYLEYAKQVFAGAYFNAGWKGDYMLLAHDCRPKDTIWFRRKGILVKHCKPIYKGIIANQPSCYVSRFYVFKYEFTKWSYVIYLDVDTLVRKPLDSLMKIEGFGAVRNYFDYIGLKNQIVHPDLINGTAPDKKRYFDLRTNLSKKCDLKKKNFCVSMFIFNTDILTPQTFNDLLTTFKKYQKIASMADESTLNFHFCNSWSELSPIFNFYIYKGKNHWRLSLNEIENWAITIHIMGRPKPWEKESIFYKEWNDTLLKADLINFKKISLSHDSYDQNIRNFHKNIRFKKDFYWYLDGFYWQLEQFYYFFLKLVKNNLPNLFKLLKIAKSKFKK